MRLKQKSYCFILAALLFCALPAVALAQVTVYAEGAYTAERLDVYIYADIPGGTPLCSYGVKLAYDGEKLTVDMANTKINEAVWYFGSPPPANTACPNCVSSTDGEIVFIGGKLDTDNPTEGVFGTRKLLAKAKFTRVGTDMNFGISLGLGKTNPSPPPSFDNFVALTTPATVLDGSVTFNPVIPIWEQGDANGDGLINSTDYVAIRNLLSSPSPPPWADCNGDGLVNSTDYVCIRNKL